MEGLSYLIPLKQNSAFIKNYGMDSPTEHLKGYTDATILYKKVRMSNGKYLYAFRDPKMAYEQEVAYVQQAQKKEAFDSEKYIEKKSLFGLIVLPASRHGHLRRTQELHLHNGRKALPAEKIWEC